MPNFITRLFSNGATKLVEGITVIGAYFGGRSVEKVKNNKK